MSREPIFVDTGAWIALLSVEDQHHQCAGVLLKQLHLERRTFVTSQAVVLEIGAGLALPRRRRFSSTFRALLSALGVEVVNVDGDRIDAAWHLFDSRPDKEWSLTDCLSFTIMNERGLTDAFAHDHHFEQAGFRALLRQK